MHMRKRNPSNAAVEATVKTICRFWAREFEGAFCPDTRALDYHLATPLAARFERDMQYLWTNASDPFGAATEASIAAYPVLYGSLDYQPERS